VRWKLSMPLTLVFCLFLFNAEALAGTPIILYSEQGQKPFSYEENGTVKGAYIESLQRVLKKLPEYDVRVRLASWARTLAEAQNGESAGVLGVYYRPKERPYLNHSKAIYRETVAVYCNRDSVLNRKFKTYPDDFAGMTFGNQSGYLAPGPRFFEFEKEGKIKVVEDINFANLVKKMLVGEIDCVVNPEPVVKMTLENLNAIGLPDRMKNQSKFIMKIKTETVHVGFSKKYEEIHPEFKKFRLLFDQAAEKQAF
jgi:polar amino acid transport system substrate-binding protein